MRKPQRAGKRKLSFCEATFIVVTMLTDYETALEDRERRFGAIETDESPTAARQCICDAGIILAESSLPNPLCLSIGRNGIFPHSKIYQNLPSIAELIRYARMPITESPPQDSKSARVGLQRFRSLPECAKG